MDKETIKMLSELGVAALALIVVVIIAYIILNRSKSDTDTIRVFADLLTQSFKDILDDVKAHGNESTSRHEEIVLVLQSVNSSLVSNVKGNDTILAKVNEATVTGDKIMETITPIDQILRDIRNELQQLRTSVDAHLESSTAFSNQIKKKTGEIEARLELVEKTTKEPPAIKPDDSESKAKEQEKTE